MPWFRTLSRWLTATAAALLSVSLVVALTGLPQPAKPQAAPGAAPSTPDAPRPLFSKTEPAMNSTHMVLLPDAKGVTGWIAGIPNYGGEWLTVKVGPVMSTVMIADDNTFRWSRSPQSRKSTKPEVASFSVPERGNKPPLTAETVLPPGVAVDAPHVFFITDRTAYRPGDTLHFVGFVRTLDDRGEFQAHANADITIDLTSQSKQTRATRLQLRTDPLGRITGSYLFSAADGLDHYRLTAHEGERHYAGTAEVVLGEYRKAKVGLKIAGEVKNGKLHLTFDPKDYLDRSMKGVSATYTATVVRLAEPSKLSLDPKGFVKPEAAAPIADDLTALPDDERLLALARGVSAVTFTGFGNRSIATREGTVKFDAEGPGTAVLDLNPEWLGVGYTVTVSGTLLDETGRENRASTTISLGPTPGESVQVTTPRELVAAGESVPVSVTRPAAKPGVTATTTLVVMKLEPGNSIGGMFGGDDDTDPSLLPAIRKPAPRKPAPTAEGWKSFPQADAVRRTVITALPVVENATTVELKSAGAYKFLAITRLSDGTVLQGETGVVVKPAAKLPGVVLLLDSREVNAGSRLRGTVHTRFADAKMLLTLRDSAGVWLAKPITTGADGIVRIDEPLPANLRYGCAVTVVYPESAGVVHADLRELYVNPTDRTISVTTKGPDTVGPGEEVRLEIDVNRQEEVDLIVSVYDEALLSVAGDLSKNIRDHYLADARGIGTAATDLAATRAGQITVAELLTRAKALSKDTAHMTRDPALQQRLNGLLDRAKGGKILEIDLLLLLQLAGFEVYSPQVIFDTQTPNIPVTPNTRLGNLLCNGNGARSLSASVIGNVVLIAFSSMATSANDVWAAHRAGTPYLTYGGFGGTYYSRQPFYYPYGSFGFQGFQGFGAFNGGFSGGFGGGGFGGGALGGAVPGGMPGGFNGSFSAPGGFQGGFSFPVPVGPIPNFDPGAAPIAAPNVEHGLVRRDFSDSAFWTADLRTNANGKATAVFKVPDSLTGWRVVVTAVSKKMHVGNAVSRFKTSRAVMIWPMLPRAFVEGDKLELFGLAVNLTDKEQTVAVNLTAKNGTVLDAATKSVKVPPNNNVPVFWTYRAGSPGMTELLMSVTSPAGSDASLKRLPIVPASVEERATAAGIVGKKAVTFTLPQGFDPAQAKLSVTIAPTLAADMADTLPYLVEYPYGCVEQTMSRFLPAIKVAQILQRFGLSTNTDLEKKLPMVVEMGVKRLLELQQPDGGWGWQGNGGTHEMMTPYALYGLLEAEKAGYTIPNAAAVDRGLVRLKQYLEQMKPAWKPANAPGAPAGRAANTAINDSLYILSVLALREPVTEEWWALIDKFAGSPQMSDYGHALALEMAAKAGKKELAAKLAAELHKRVKRAGSGAFWTTAGFSNWGDNSNEVTAACLKALVAHDPQDALIPEILHHFAVTKQGDRWTSTKDTAMILYALCDYLTAVRDDKFLPGGKREGMASVAVNGKPAGEYKLAGPVSNTTSLLTKELKPGENTLEVQSEVAAGSLVRVIVTFTRGAVTEIPARDFGVKVVRTISVREKDGKWRELKNGAAIPKGSFVKVTVTGTPTDQQPLTYTLIESPKPATGEVLPQDDTRPVNVTRGGYNLREDRETKICFHYQHANQQVVGEYVFLAEFTGEFHMPPARIEPMYRPTNGGHSDSFILKVTGN